MNIKTLYTEEQKKWNEEYNSQIDDIEQELNSLYMEIVETRKSGKDPLVAEYYYMNIKSKIKYVRAAKNQNEIIEIKNKIEELKKEINDAKKQEIVNIKKEFENRLKQEGIHYIGERKDEE